MTTLKGCIYRGKFMYRIIFPIVRDSLTREKNFLEPFLLGVRPLFVAFLPVCFVLSHSSPRLFVFQFVVADLVDSFPFDKITFCRVVIGA